ncbi:MAG: sulfatase activating formylglycine-generating enzyme [Rhodothermales bacterium]|jgi:formylglycine-generating enzyme required for sulfatase activity/tRNA A-37 threonylcarbamoyl transferase component Bud32
MADDEFPDGDDALAEEGEPHTLPSGEVVRKLKLQRKIGEGEATVNLSAEQVRSGQERRRKPLRLKRMAEKPEAETETQPPPGNPQRKLRISQADKPVEEDETVDLEAPPSRGESVTVGPPEIDIDSTTVMNVNIVEPSPSEEIELEEVATFDPSPPSVAPPSVDEPVMDEPPSVDEPGQKESSFEFSEQPPQAPPEPKAGELPLNVPLAALPTQVDERNTVVLDLADIQIGDHNDYDRYHSFATLGVGGNGTVHACIDPHLSREVALKVLHPKMRDDMKAQRRFIREAHIMALIEHPNVLPLHEMGKREDGTIYFTMKRIRGESLHDIINGLKVGDPAYQDRYPLRRMMDIFAHICHAVAFAHSRHIIHRDLKPENIFIGSFGEVQVCDWGLARVLGDVEQEELQGVTMDGSVMGTPHYMAPEQVAGRISDLDERTDVYSLGVILYQILTYQRPFASDSIAGLMEAVLKQDPTPPRKQAPQNNIPVELAAICGEAMHKEQVDRYQSANDLVADIENWQASHPVSAYPVSPVKRAWKWCVRNPVFSCTVTGIVTALIVAAMTAQMVGNMDSTSAIDVADKFRQEGLQQFARKTQLYSELATLREARVIDEKSETEKQAEDELAALHRSSEAQLAAAETFYQMAGNQESSDWQDAINEIYKARMDYAMLTGEGKEFIEPPGPQEDPKIQKIVNSMKSEGKLSIESTPAGANVTLHALEPDERGVMTPGPAEPLGTTPVAARTLAKGSYLLIFEVADHAPLHAPVFIDHGETETASVAFPDTVPEGMVYIPAGRFFTGGDPGNRFHLHETHLDGYFIREKEVTFRDYREFWTASDGANSEPKFTPQIRFSRDIIEFVPAWNESGELHPSLRFEFPVVGITQHAAERYCHWLSRKVSRDCLLPTAQQWEKAARGVDGREFVWGDKFLPDRALCLENASAMARFPVFAPPGAFPGDVSVYGVYDMAGNVREWTRSPFERNSPFFQIKGASASTDQHFMRCASASEAVVVPTDVGFRYVITLDR